VSEKAAEISRKMKVRAQELDKRLRAVKETSRTSTLEIGWLGAKLKEGNFFPILGYDNETLYRQAVGVGRSTWFRYVRLAEAFKKLPEKEFMKFNAECADHLAKLPEDKRYRKDLIKKAQELTEEEFQKVIVRFKARESKVSEGDVIVQLKWRMPEGRREVIMDTLRWFAKEHELSMEDESRILELLCAEVRHGKPVVTKMAYAAQDLSRAVELLENKDTELSQDEIVSKVKGVLEQVIRGIHTAAGVQPPKAKAKAAGVGD
jgi:hypothetical protein